MSQNRMPTRRCTRAKVPCQQINNIFCQNNNFHIPDYIYKKLPTTKKVTCQHIQKITQLIPPNKSKQQILKEMKQNVKSQYTQIQKLINQEILPDNVNDKNKENDEIKKQQDINIYQTTIKKKIKLDYKTCQLSDYQIDSKKDDNIFIDQRIIERLEDYLTID